MQDVEDEVPRAQRHDSPWLSSCAVLSSSLLFLLTATAIGCGTLSYKTGSTEGDYQAASDRCQKEGRSEGADFAHCMQDQGWITKRLGVASPGDVKKPPPAVSQSPEPPPAPAAGAAKEGVTAERPSPASQPVPAAGDAHGSVADESPSPTSQPVPAGDTHGSVAAEPPSPTSPPASDAGDAGTTAQRGDAPAPQDSVVVKNWFKFGGTADELAAAQQRCAVQLGVANPSPESEVVTSEMLDCLQKAGWHAF